MIALFHDAPAIEHDQPVRRRDGGQPVAISIVKPGQFYSMH
jgi:hypothetical protein